MKFFNAEIDEVFDVLDACEDGLSSKEAENRLDVYGANKLQEAKKDSFLKKFLGEFRDLMIIVLIIYYCQNKRN